VLSKLAEGRPITAVIKNNGYGLGLTEVAKVLDNIPSLSGFGVVKVAEALALREAGITKPILLLAIFDDADGETLVRQRITLSLCVPDIGRRAALAMTRAGMPARGQFYIDTGMSRMGLPYHRALPILKELARTPRLEIVGTLSELTEDKEFDVEQVKRLSSLAAEAKAAGLSTGPLHAASSHAVFNNKATLLDAVRPGISIFGAYPTDDGSEKSIAQLSLAFRLKARVVRVEQMRAGDTVSYGRRFKADEPTWVATIPVGHADGYPRRAVQGGRVLIGDRTYPIVGAVSASHAIANLGPSTSVKVGDLVTLLGPDDPAIHPNTLAGAAGISVYDVLMHLSPGLPRFVV
jgi:alanine racemase